MPSTNDQVKAVGLILHCLMSCFLPIAAPTTAYIMDLLLCVPFLSPLLHRCFSAGFHENHCTIHFFESCPCVASL